MSENSRQHEQELDHVAIDQDVTRIRITEAALRWKLFDVQFATWEPRSLHWVAPSNIIIYSDGSWFLYARHIANFRRTGGFFDSGDHWTWLVNVQFINTQGSVVHAKDYVLGGLGYKDERDNATSQGVDSRLAEVQAQIVSARFTRIIR